jgi:uncharacterized protein
VQPVVGRQRWRNMLFLHYRCEPRLLRPHVPPWLELDLHEGAAWVTVIPFAIEDARPRFLPRRLGLSFLEINVRTYVRNGDDRGLWFFSLEASSMLAVAAARAGIGLPYRLAKMSIHQTQSGETELTSRRLGFAPAAKPTCSAAGAPMGRAEKGTLDHFLIERYVLFTDHLGLWLRERVRHPPYHLNAGELLRLEDELTEACGLGRMGPPTRIHHSPGVDVDFLAPHRVRSSGAYRIADSAA